MNKIVKYLDTLSTIRPLYHSEFDFQHELAMIIRADLKANDTIRLERSYHFENRKKIELDLFIQIDDIKIGIELTYPIQGCNQKVNGEQFILSNQNNPGGSRYSFLEDIYRLETLKACKEINKGYALMLTNIKSFYLDKKTEGRLETLRLYNERIINARETINSIHPIKKFPSFIINNSYELIWKEYNKEHNMKYLLVEI